MSPMIYTAYGFAIFFLVFWCGKWCIHLMAIGYGKYKLHRKVMVEQTDQPMPSVSILKPLMGVDPNLKQNLETFFNMNYPAYELLFCIEDPNDKAVDLVHELCARFPDVRTQLFLGGSNVGVNPKINNMHAGYESARSDYIMISDSGIRMKEDTLLDMVQHMTGRTALVHQMPFTCDREGFAATFEKIFFGTVQSRIYLTADLLGINCHTGMSCLLRADVLAQLGGLRAFGCYLAEDFFIAKAVSDGGWRTAVCTQPAMQNSGICDLGCFQARLTRWAKLRQAMMPTMIVMEPLSECMVVGMCASWAVSVLFGWTALVFYLVHVLMWFLSDWMLLSIVQNGTLPFNKFEFVVGWLFREFSGPYLFVLALWNPAIQWRTRVYKLAWGGLAYELDERKAAAVAAKAVAASKASAVAAAAATADHHGHKKHSLAARFSETVAALPPLKKSHHRRVGSVGGVGIVVSSPAAGMSKASKSPLHHTLHRHSHSDAAAVDVEHQYYQQQHNLHYHHQPLHQQAEMMPLMQVVVCSADEDTTVQQPPAQPSAASAAAAATSALLQHSSSVAATSMATAMPMTVGNGSR